MSECVKVLTRFLPKQAITAESAAIAGATDLTPSTIRPFMLLAGNNLFP
jgi:hypothetical protein